MTKSRALIVEDEALYAEMLSHTLAEESTIDVVGSAEDGETAIKLVEELKPDAVLMDIMLSGEMNGIAAGLKIKEMNPEIGVVILSSHRERQYVANVPFSDVQGWAYLLKQSVRDMASVVRAIQGSINGMVVLDPAVVVALKPKEGSLLAGLTPRQLDVLKLMAQGYNNAAIAKQLALAEKSVETYINNIYQELHISGGQGIHGRVTATLLYLNESSEG